MARLIEREGIIHNDNEASTSQRSKPSWCKHPSRSLETNSNEYEWDTLSEEASMIDMEVNVIHSYSSQLDVVDDSSVGTNESNPRISLADHASSFRAYPNLDLFGDLLTGSESLVIEDDSFLTNNLESSTSLPLVYLDLFDWSIQNEKNDLPSF